MTASLHVLQLRRAVTHIALKICFITAHAARYLNCLSLILQDCMSCRYYPIQWEYDEHDTHLTPMTSLAITAQTSSHSRCRFTCNPSFVTLCHTYSRTVCPGSPIHLKERSLHADLCLTTLMILWFSARQSKEYHMMHQTELMQTLHKQKLS